MNFEILIQSLRNRDDQLCSAAADELERLNTKFDELGRAYDAMSADVVRLVEENRSIRRDLWKYEHNK